MGKLKDLMGQKFGILTVISRVPNDKHGRAKWLCKCDCGNETVVQGNHLREGQTKSCGCLRAELVSKAQATHRLTKSRTYKSWISMKTRCDDHKNEAYGNYGGRGIKVCDDWYSFENFLRDMGERPKGKTLDRKDNNKGYYKDNCRWATICEQENNRRNNRRFTINGETMTLSQWGYRYNVDPRVVSNRLKIGWDIKKCLETPSKAKIRKPKEMLVNG